jgi:pimeloyl-ACP methyl ester carboxylesterase
LLVVHDEDDRAVPFEGGYRLSRAWPGARFRATNGLGHARILRDPETVRAAVDFIRGAA